MDKFDTKWLNGTEVLALAEWSGRHGYVEIDFEITKESVQELSDLLVEKGVSPKDVLNEYWDNRSEGINPIAGYAGFKDYDPFRRL